MAQTINVIVNKPSDEVVSELTSKVFTDWFMKRVNKLPPQERIIACDKMIEQLEKHAN